MQSFPKTQPLEKIKEGEVLLQEGKVANEMFFICNGILKIVSISDKGNEVIHFFLSENQFCTILKSFSENVISTDRIQQLVTPKSLF